MITCSYDYLTDDWNHKSFILYAFICNYVMPMITVIFFYSQIVKAVVSHEAALRKQAEKMNVESLRSNAVRFLWVLPVLTTSSLNEDKGNRYHKRGERNLTGGTVASTEFGICLFYCKPTGSLQQRKIRIVVWTNLDPNDATLLPESYRIPLNAEISLLVIHY